MDDKAHALRNVAANQALEGLTLPARTVEQAKAVADGTLDVEDAIDSLRREALAAAGDETAAAG